jgi:F-type H+-transporting ATPase subunit gamma
MSGKLRDIDARIGAIGQLGTVMAAMRGIASMRTQQALDMLPGIRAYEAMIERALARLLATTPIQPSTNAADRSDRLGLVLFSVEHGFAGAYPERLAEVAERAFAPDCQIFVVGARGLRLARERHWPVAWHAAMASQSAAVGTLARRVAETLYARLAAGAIGRVELVHGRPGPAYTQELVHRSLLPLDLGRLHAVPSTGPAPLLGLPAPRLLDRLIEEYIIGALTEAAMESFAAENAARLSTMEAAGLHIADQLEDLEGDARRLRQEETTGELMDVVAGWRAVSRTR